MAYSDARARRRRAWYADYGAAAKRDADNLLWRIFGDWSYDSDRTHIRWVTADRLDRPGCGNAGGVRKARGSILRVRAESGRGGHRPKSIYLSQGQQGANRAGARCRTTFPGTRDRARGVQQTR